MSERESYTVSVDGSATLEGEGLSRRAALIVVLAVLDDPSSTRGVRQVDIIEQATREPRASWRRDEKGWHVESVPAWLS